MAHVPEGERITWLLPVKNGMPYLTEALASIQAQTYHNYEVLAWDNGSIDDSVAELTKWIPDRLPGSVVVDRPLPLGDCLARMVERAQTELCARIDSDDVNLPNRLELQVSHLSQHPEIGVLGGRAYLIDETGGVAKLARALASLPLDHEQIVPYLSFTNKVCHPTVMMRRSVVLRSGNYRKIGPPEVNIEDYDLWFRVAKISRIANLAKPLILYRSHATSTTYFARTSGLLRPAMAECYYEHANDIFGSSKMSAKLLQSRSHPLFLLELIRMARFYSRNARKSFWSTILSEVFLDIGTEFAPRWDLPSRLLLAGLSGHLEGVRTEGIEISKDVLRAVGLFELARRCWGREKPCQVAGGGIEAHTDKHASTSPESKQQPGNC